MKVSLPGIIILLSAVCASCTLPSAWVDVVQGNVSFRQGDWQTAMVAYLKAKNVDQRLQPYVTYNLANIYHNLGEVGVAFRLWNSAKADADPDLAFALAFNSGVAHYEQGQYAEATAFFREALRLRPSSLDAKINLELSAKKARLTGTPSDLVTVPPDPAAIQETKRILDYVRQKEEARWYQSAPEGAKPVEGDR